jgi:hypothetical protein
MKGAPTALATKALSMVELVGGLAALVLTLALLSYLAADNPLYRIAAHLFIGLSAGYAVVLAWHTVIVPHLARLATLGPLGGSSDLLTAAITVLVSLVGVVGGILLLLKTLRIGTSLGSLVVAGVLGVGAAAAVGGAITGTLLPQTQAAWVSLLPVGQAADSFELAELIVQGVFMVTGTLATLGFFWYGGRAGLGSPVQRSPLARPVAAVGQVFIAVTFGVMYAGALAASVAVFAERLDAIFRIFEL